ncbi:MAG TPA: enoyl-CoA hydratase-related protein [Cytophagaceae bacterium]|jgi:methylglutaconyl-CoA hydratase
MTYKYITYTVNDRIATITLNRPEKKNALNFGLISELKDALSQSERSEAVKVIILKGNGDVFCAGADIEYLQQLQKNSDEENLADSTHLKELYKQIYLLEKVVIAQVNGHAIAGGCGLVSVCDFAYAAPEANFGYSEVRIGFIPAIVMVFLIRKIGEARSKELLISGTFISANEAKNFGLINHVSASLDQLEIDVLAFANKLCLSNSQYSMKTTKLMIGEVQNMDLDTALDYASRKNAEARASEDCIKGIANFLDKKKLNW